MSSTYTSKYIIPGRRAGPIKQIINDINGGAPRATYRIHHSLLKQGVNSRLWVNEKKSNDPTVKELNNKIGKACKKLRPRVINYFIVKMLKTESKAN